MTDTTTNPLRFTSIKQALSFDQAKDNELIQSIKLIIPTLPESFRDEMNIYMISPLIANTTAKLDNNKVIVQVDITNNQNYEWFIKKDDNLYIYLNGGKRLYYFTNSDFIRPSNGAEVMRIISDNDYRLIRANETLTFQRELSAEELYKNWQGQDIFIQYNVRGMPPTISSTYLQLYNQGKMDGVYQDYLVANQVRIRCYGYDKEHDQYQCDIDNNDHTQFR